MQTRFCKGSLLYGFIHCFGFPPLSLAETVAASATRTIKQREPPRRILFGEDRYGRHLGSYRILNHYMSVVSAAMMQMQGLPNLASGEAARNGEELSRKLEIQRHAVGFLGLFSPKWQVFRAKVMG